MTYNYSALLGKITEVYNTQYNFAIAMGYSERTISLKLNGKVPWKDDEMVKAANLLGIEIKDIPIYFFNPKVHV